VDGRAYVLAQHLEMRGERRDRTRNVTGEPAKRSGLEQVDVHELPHGEMRRQPGLERDVPRVDGIEKARQPPQARVRIAHRDARHQQRPHRSVKLESVHDGQRKPAHDMSQS
jgi:hypothetical protein